MSLLGGAAIIAATLPAFAQDNVTLDEIVIDGGNDNGTGGNSASGTGKAASTADDAYVAKRTTTGSKTNTPLAEIPQSIAVISSDELEQRRPAQLEDALAYTSGLVASPWGTDDRFDECLIRGFDLCTSALYRDGLSQRLIGFAGFKIEPYGMERIEVIKGPAGVLYGENDAGGIINAVTKRPPAEQIREAYASYGSFNTVEAGFDVGGPTDPSGVWSYRLTGLFRDGGTQIDDTKNDRIYIAPALTWQPDAQTSLTILAHYQWDKMGAIYSVPVPGMTGYTGPEVPRSFFTGQPGFDRFDANYGSIGYQFSHEFNDNWTVRQNLRYARQDTDYMQLYFGDADGNPAVRPDGHTIARTAYGSDEVATAFSIDNQVEFDQRFGAVDNKLLAGLDYSRWISDGQGYYGAGPDLDILSPDYSFVLARPPLYEDLRETVDQVGLYVQNQAKIADRLVVTAGARKAWFDIDDLDRMSNTVTAQDDSALVGQIGAAYLLDGGITPYASYTQTFVVNPGQTRTGSLFEPSEGEQYEAGVKYEPTFMPGYITAALFDIRKSNVLTTDPTDSNFQVQTGEVRHRGFEFEAKAEILSGFDLTAAYTFIDAEITKDNDGYVGMRPSLVPEHTASLWANYAFGENTVLNGLSVGLGVRYVGSTFGDNANTLVVPSYTVADAALRYKRGQWEAAFNVSNLFDKKYFSTCYVGEGRYYGEARNIRGSLNLNF